MNLLQCLPRLRPRFHLHHLLIQHHLILPTPTHIRVVHQPHRAAIRDSDAVAARRNARETAKVEGDDIAAIHLHHCPDQAMIHHREVAGKMITKTELQLDQGLGLHQN